MRSLFYLGCLFLSFNLYAQNFGPVKNGVTRLDNEHTQVLMYLDSKEGGNYSFTVGNKLLTTPNGKPHYQQVFPGMQAIFPFTINNRYINNGKVMICSMEYNPKAKYTRDVCYNVKVEIF